MRKYRNYTDEDVIQAAAKVKSMAGLMKALNLIPAGGNYANMKRLVQKLKINTDHWTGQAWCRDAQLKDWSDYTKGASVKPHLIKKRGHKCESCNLEQWLGEKIALEIHHLDGNNTNNAELNLQLVCPNCHAFTENYRRPKYILNNITT